MKHQQIYSVVIQSNDLNTVETWRFTVDFPHIQVISYEKRGREKSKGPMQLITNKQPVITNDIRLKLTVKAAEQLEVMDCKERQAA